MRKVIIALICAVLVWHVGTSVIANATRKNAPETALRFRAHDSAALAAAADQNLIASLNRGNPAAASEAARESLLGQAINPRSLRILGYIADSKGDNRKAMELMGLSGAASRREAGAHFWHIEDSVRKEDVSGALAHYDLALLTSSDNGKILFPILNAALGDPEVQASFVRFINTPPRWLRAFLVYVVEQSGNPLAIAATITRAGGLPPVDTYRTLESTLLGELASKGAYMEARSYFMVMRGADKRLLTSIGFDLSATMARFAPISWELLETPGIVAGFGRDRAGAEMRMHVSAASGYRGTAARKFLYLAPGAYDFALSHDPLQLANGAMARLDLRCANGVLTQTLWQNGDDAGNPRPVLIPVNCEAQVVELEVAGGADQNGAELIIRSMSLMKK